MTPVLAQVGELDDAGYWYAAPAIIEDGSVSAPLSDGYCAQYGEVDGVLYAVMRIPVSTTVEPSDVNPADVIEAAFAAGNIPSAEKFYARVGGK